MDGKKNKQIEQKAKINENNLNPNAGQSTSTSNSTSATATNQKPTSTKPLKKKKKRPQDASSAKKILENDKIVEDKPDALIAKDTDNDDEVDSGSLSDTPDSDELDALPTPEPIDPKDPREIEKAQLKEVGKSLKKVQTLEKNNSKLAIDEEFGRNFLLQEAKVTEDGDEFFSSKSPPKTHHSISQPPGEVIAPGAVIQEHLPIKKPIKTSKKLSKSITIKKEDPTRRAKAIKRLKELEEERIALGPDPEQLRRNKELERLVAEQSLAKKAIFDILDRTVQDTAARKQNIHESTPSSKKFSGNDEGVVPSNTYRKSDLKHPQAAVPFKPFANLTLEELESRIYNEEELRKVELERRFSDAKDKKTHEERRTSRIPKSSADESDLFKSIRRERPALAENNKPWTEFAAPVAPVEYQDFCFGNARFLDIDRIAPLEKIKHATDTQGILGMAQNSDWVKLHFDIPVEKEPPRQEERKKKPEKVKEDDQPTAAAVPLNQNLIDSIKENTGIDYGKIKVVSHIPRDFMYRRPPRQVIYKDFPAQKAYYGADWDRVNKDVRRRVKKQKALAEFIFDEGHAKEKFQLMRQRAELSSLGKRTFKEWFKKNKELGDYFEWLRTGYKPIDLDKNDDDNSNTIIAGNVGMLMNDGNDPSAGKKKRWFSSPPKFFPPSPHDSLFSEYNFCSYGERKKPYFMEFSIPRTNILYYSMYKDIEIFYNTIRKPEGSFPGFAFPRWLKWPLDQKLPQHSRIPAESMIWTRGLLGQPLHPMHDTHEPIFRLDDPMNLRMYKYDILHDPACNQYLALPQVKRLLWRQKLITKDGDVVCTQKEQNHYRNYLREHIWVPEFRKLVKLSKARNDQLRAGYMYISHQITKNWPAQVEHKKKIVQEAHNLKAAKQKLLADKVQQQEEYASKRLAQKKEEQKLIISKRKEKQSDRQERARQYRLWLADAKHQIKDAGTLISENKQYRASENKMTYQQQKLIEADEKRRIFWVKKVHALEEAKKIAEWTETVTREDRQKKVLLRQRKVAEHRLRLPKLIAARKAEEERIYNIVRKYALLWWNKVKQSLKQDINEDRLTVFNVKKSTGKTVKDLMKMTDYRKLSTVISGILGRGGIRNLKERILAEQLREEQEEMQLLAMEDEREMERLAREAEVRETSSDKRNSRRSEEAPRRLSQGSPDPYLKRGSEEFYQQGASQQSLEYNYDAYDVDYRNNDDEVLESNPTGNDGT